MFLSFWSKNIKIVTQILEFRSKMKNIFESAFLDFAKFHPSQSHKSNVIKNLNFEPIF